MYFGLVISAIKQEVKINKNLINRYFIVQNVCIVVVLNVLFAKMR